MKSLEKGIKASSELFFSGPSNQAKKLFFYVTCIGRFAYEDWYELKRENYNSYLIMYVVRGALKIETEGISYIAHSGETVLINCHKFHSYSSLGNLDTLWLHFDGANAESIYNELNSSYGSVILIRNSHDMINRIHKVYDAFRSGRKVIEAVQSANISRILAEFFKSQIIEAADKKTMIDKVINHIEENYEQDLTVPDLAVIAGLSDYYFIRIIKKETGFTPHEYIIRSRIIGAKLLLKSTTMTLKEIAYKCGFSNESSFSNTFKRITKMTPGSFRDTEI